jgi:ABC-2 type transport system permease protein
VNAVRIVARKELRSTFESPVALIFLGIFLVATLAGFFGYSSFFARNLADVRPLFAWMPALLVLLVAAVSMRQWAEERKMGTLEVLLTLPVPTRDLVLGKFVAGVALVALALALTLPIPFMVSMLGDLDWGPVVGGYVGALLLGATYLSIGLCVSARTDNQVVSLMVTGVIGAALVAIGSDPLTELFGQTTSEVLRALGTGSRFASIERGVLDLRDLAYYAGLTTFFLVLNWAFLEAARVDRSGAAGRRHARWLAAYTGLVGLNVVALTVWLAPVSAARVDLTEGGLYSISRVTRETLHDLDEPLRIDAFFSERTHPLLAPLVPQLRDLLEEIEIAGRGNVVLRFADPNADEALEQEIGERYDIRSVPFQVADRHQQSVVNAFFHVLLRYGDQFEVLSFDELVEVRYEDEDLIVRLENPEYDITRTIRRISRDFQNMESIFARMPGEVRLTLFVTPDRLPEAFAEAPAQVRDVVADLERAADGKLVFREEDPSTDPERAESLAEEYRIRPLAVDLFGEQTFYFDLLLETADGAQRIAPRGDLSEAQIRNAIESAIRRASPGQLKTIGLYTQTPPTPPADPRRPPHMQPPAPERDYRGLEQIFGEDYRVRFVELGEDDVPDEVDILIVGKAGALTDAAQRHLDQYVMRGGKVIALAGRYAIDVGSGRLAAAPQDGPLFDLLETWGITVESALVMDPQNASFPVPVEEQRGMFRVQRIEMLPYPFFPDIRRDGMAQGHPALVGLQNVTTPWASPLVVEPPEGVEAEILLESSPESWRNTSGSIEPDLRRFPEVGFGPEGEIGRSVLAASLTGVFPSHVAGRQAEETTDGGPPPRLLESSLPDARVTVIGSAEIVSDLMIQLAARMGGEVHRSNLQLLQNLVDWSLEDTDLLAIRSAGSFARTLVPLDESEARAWELGCYGLSAGLLGLVTLLPRRLRHVEPLATPEEEAA